MIDVFLSRLNKAIPAVAIFISLFFAISYAGEQFPFQGIVKEEGINIRCDSTVNAAIICNAKKSQELTVVSESYGWYRVRLPETAPAYISRGLAACIDGPCRDARVLKDKARVRLKADRDSPVLGVAQKGRIVHVLAKNDHWYRIQPLEDSYAWIHKRFVERGPAAAQGPVTLNPPAAETLPEQIIPVKEAQAPPQGGLVITGIVAPYGKVLGRKATHKLISRDKKIFLLKGDKKELNNFNYRRVRVSGTKSDLQKNKRFPIIEVVSMEEIK